jgi:hypothetical protein
MTDGYDCDQNTLGERVNGILKHEFPLQPPDDLRQARRMVVRRHLQLEAAALLATIENAR